MYASLYSNTAEIEQISKKNIYIFFRKSKNITFRLEQLIKFANRFISYRHIGEDKTKYRWSKKYYAIMINLEDRMNKLIKGESFVDRLTGQDPLDGTHTRVQTPINYKYASGYKFISR